MAHKSNPYKKAGHHRQHIHVVRRRCECMCFLPQPAPGSLEVPLEVEEEANAPIAEEAPKDAPALEVRRL